MSFVTEQDITYMKRAIELARKGTGRTAPNPLVGAVIVKNGEILGEGWHERYGELHAERNALLHCKGSAEGADMYVTLEPCCHYGKQPPCTDAVIAAGIKRVFIGSYDPNPLVSGKSGEILRSAGIETIYQVLEEECDRLNPFFFYYMKHKMPYVICKYAMTADGKIACMSGDSKWVTGAEARADVQETRRAVSAIMVGIGTVLADDPSLLCRADDPIHPVRVVCDTRLRFPEDCFLANSTDKAPVIIMTSRNDRDKIKRLEEKGVEVCILPEKDGHTDIEAVLRTLANRGLTSVLAEGGAGIHAALIKAGLVQEVQVYIAPKISGGDGISPVGSLDISKMSDAFELEVQQVHMYGSDILLIFKMKGAEA